MESLVPAPVHWVVATAMSFDIILHKRRPASAVLWLAVVWALPIWGALGYLVIGVDQIRRFAPGPERLERLFHSYITSGPESVPAPAEAALVASTGAREAGPGDVEGAEPTRGEHAAPPDGERAESAAVGRPERADPAETGRAQRAMSAAQARALTRRRGAHILRLTGPAIRPYRITHGNRIELLVDGVELYPAMEQAIDTAKERIDFQTYILTPDVVGRGLVDRLAARAAAGVRVRLLYDGFGSALSYLTGLLRDARWAGIEVAASHPRGYPNLRNHRKVAVIDGRVAFVGGLNMDDRNLPGPAGSPPDRDYHTRILGPVVRDLEFQFLIDWSRATGQALEDIIRDTPPRWTPTDGDALAQVIPGGPERSGGGLAMAFFGAIAAAERSVAIVTPYFLPDDTIVAVLRYAATRGVDIRIVLPARSNHWYTAHAARALYEGLLEVGVRIFERRPPFMHAKALVVDGVYSLLGSANLDYRSLFLNFELDLEVASETFARAVLSQIELEIAESREVSLEAYRRRPLGRKLTESVCRLLHPML